MKLSRKALMGFVCALAFALFALPAAASASDGSLAATGDLATQAVEEEGEVHDGSTMIYPYKLYTGKFNGKGIEDIQRYRFVSGGGSYKVKVWDLSGRKGKKFGKVEQFYDGDYYLTDRTLAGIVTDYGEYMTFSSAGGAPEEFQMGGFMGHEFYPDISKKGKILLQETVDMGSFDKGKTVGILFEGDYKGKFQFMLLGKKAEGAPSVKGTLASTTTTVSVKDAEYTGKKLKPAVTVKYMGKKLKKNRDYTVKYSKNVKVGKGKVTVKGKGKYTGSVKATFKITKASIANAKVSGLKTMTFAHKALKPAFTVKCNGKKLKKGRDYTVKYSRNTNPGKAKVTIKGKGSYAGKKTATFKIKAKGKVYSLAYGCAKNNNPNSTNNINLIRKAIANLKIPGYAWATSDKVEVVDVEGFVKKDFLAKLESTFADTTSNDISIIYLNTHSKGYSDVDYSPGLSTGPDWNDFYAWSSVLYDIADNVKGKIIFLPEVCNSGNFVDVADANTFTARNRMAIITAADAYRGAQQIGFVVDPEELVNSIGHAVTGLSKAQEESRQKIYFGKGTYTKALAKALGYGKGYLAADGAKTGLASPQKDGKLTLNEVFAYVSNDNGVEKSGQSPMRHIGSAFDDFVLYKK